MSARCPAGDGKPHSSDCRWVASHPTKRGFLARLFRRASAVSPPRPQPASIPPLNIAFTGWPADRPLGLLVTASNGAMTATYQLRVKEGRWTWATDDATWRYDEYTSVVQ